MKTSPWKPVAAFLLAGVAFNVVWGWARGWPLTPSGAALSVVLFVALGMLGLSTARGVALGRNVATDDAGGVARVFVNEVEVGSLPAVQYRRLVREAWTSKWLYASQAANLAGVLLRAVVAVVRNIPWVWFSALALAAVFAPDGLRETFARVAAGSPTQLVDAVRQALSGAALISVVACGASVGFGVERFGYVNRFDEVIGQRIRKILEVPAEGSMRVTVVQFVRGHVQ